MLKHFYHIIQNICEQNYIHYLLCVLDYLVVGIQDCLHKFSKPVFLPTWGHKDYCKCHTVKAIISMGCILSFKSFTI